MPSGHLSSILRIHADCMLLHFFRLSEFMGCMAIRSYLSTEKAMVMNYHRTGAILQTHFPEACKKKLNVWV